MTLTDFLLARIAEDEAAANDASALSWRLGTWRAEHTVLAADGETYIAECGHTSEAFRDGVHIARHDPARILAECEAKRRIVACDAAHLVDDGMPEECYLHEDTLRDLAAVYADHPDYREEWRP